MFTARGASSPARPALIIPDPLSITRAMTSSSSSSSTGGAFLACPKARLEEGVPFSVALGDRSSASSAPETALTNRALPSLARVADVTSSLLSPWGLLSFAASLRVRLAIQDPRRPLSLGYPKFPSRQAAARAVFPAGVNENLVVFGFFPRYVPSPLQQRELGNNRPFAFLS